MREAFVACYSFPKYFLFSSAVDLLRDAAAVSSPFQTRSKLPTIVIHSSLGSLGTSPDLNRPYLTASVKKAFPMGFWPSRNALDSATRLKAGMERPDAAIYLWPFAPQRAFTNS